MEIERKFILSHAPADFIEHGSKYVISQGYLFDNGKLTLRIRQMNDQYFMTVKTGKGLSRHEIEQEITEEQYQALHVHAESVLHKTRYIMVDNGHDFEIDVFEGNLSGLVLLEVEFNTKEEALEFTPPSWVGREVTEDGKYTNASLAAWGLPD